MPTEEFPTTPTAFCELARSHVDEFRASQSLHDLLPAVLATTHTPEWHPTWRKTVRSYDRGVDRPVLVEFKRTHWEWDIVRQVANGVKHCKLQSGDRLTTLARRQLEWEDNDFWHAADDLERRLWFVNNDGRDHVLHLLCSRALDRFEKLLKAASAIA